MDTASASGGAMDVTVPADGVLLFGRAWVKG
jgi:hypothetical protein